ncbi:hypothetical protein C2G38_2158874 [Gigaspora rosea]|uniref:Uncharacterized protein n=1 Tax=Gigaspora rosea TaxID=44941 RepID=A0A397W029_9GLOM|nr:hypothetical protein C2G38_2158874 [Gigaspora rosea]
MNKAEENRTHKELTKKLPKLTKNLLENLLETMKNPPKINERTHDKLTEELAKETKKWQTICRKTPPKITNLLKNLLEDPLKCEESKKQICEDIPKYKELKKPTKLLKNQPKNGKQLAKRTCQK